MKLFISGSCREVQTCNLQSWSSWSGHVPTNKCSQQNRYRGWSEQNVRYRVQDNNGCNGIRSSCGNGEYDYRTRCKLKFFNGAYYRGSGGMSTSVYIPNGLIRVLVLS
jgi:hypothetical protein